MNEEQEINLRINQIDQEVEILLIKMANIHYQIDTANAKKQMDGIHSDKHWLSKAKYALKLNGAKHQTLKNERGDLSRKLKAIQQKSHDRDLLNAFKEIVANDIGEKRCFYLFGLALEEVS